MNKDPLYFPRTELANRLLISLKDGITHALTLFAPRRMGKTQFLLNDVRPKAQEMGFNVFYFSFMDKAENEIKVAFVSELMRFTEQATNGKIKLGQAIEQLKSIDILGIGVELEAKKEQTILSISRLISELAEKSPKPILMLLDEVQELARVKGSADVVKSLRTGLDINQNKVKVIFTGSSTNGLMAMFNDNKAPFFHFAHALGFPNLDRAFTDFLTGVYQERTGKTIDKNHFFDLFKRFHYTPLYMRSIIQDMIINPNLSLDDAVDYRINQMIEQGDIITQWQKLSLLERQLLILIANDNTALYSRETRRYLSKLLGVDEEIKTSSIQGKIRKLEKKEYITRSLNGDLKINNPHFQTWIKENN